MGLVAAVLVGCGGGELEELATSGLDEDDDVAATGSGGGGGENAGPSSGVGGEAASTSATGGGGGMPAPPEVTAITAISTHACAVFDDGNMKCWGDSAELAPTTDVAVGSAGSDVDCVAHTNGTASCWGANFFGQLGNGSQIDSATPVPVSGLASVVDISVGSGHACAVIADGSGYCWGHNGFGQIGDGTQTPRVTTPARVEGLTGAAKIYAGYVYSCAILDTGSVACWGRNDHGQLGNGNTANSTVPVAVIGITDAVSLALTDHTACAVLADGTARCWGENDWGQLGNQATTDPDSDTPVTIDVLGDVVITDIALGYEHTCAALDDGTARCWGRADRGQLGDGTNMVTGYPKTVSLDGIVDIAAGPAYTCALVTDGSVHCWGYGALGNGDDEAAAPVAVIGL